VKSKKDIHICGEVFKPKRTHFSFETLYKQIEDMSELKKLQEFPKLQAISLNGTSINDIGLQYVGQCATITNLNLTFTNISDKGIAHLVNLKNLQWLRLKDTDISKKSVPFFNQMKGLISLQIHETEISGKDVASLNLPNLEELMVDCEDDLDYKTLLNLSEKLPKCEIISKGKGIFRNGNFES
jgi:Leucine-rich repeat (LRR) protein